MNADYTQWWSVTLLIIAFIISHLGNARRWRHQEKVNAAALEAFEAVGNELDELEDICRTHPR